MMLKFLFFLSLWNSLWASHELEELKYYQREIEDWLKSYPGLCRTYSQLEMDAVPKFVALRNGYGKTAETRIYLIGLMKGMNEELRKYHRFKSMCAAGIIRSNQIRTCGEWALFREKYCEFEAEKHSYLEIEAKCLEYCGIFLAKPGLISVLSDDRDVNVPRYKAITEPVYKYLKKLYEELVYCAGWIGNYYELRDEAALKIQVAFRKSIARKKAKGAMSA